MIKINWLILMICSCIPPILAHFWFQGNWQQRFLKFNNQTNMHFSWNLGAMLGLILLSLLYSISMSYQAIHQLHFQSMLLNEVGFRSEEGNAYKDLINIFELYGKNFRSFGHGAFHGFLNSIFLILPILTFHKMICKIDWKFTFYIWIYWAICSMLIGGIICELY